MNVILFLFFISYVKFSPLCSTFFSLQIVVYTHSVTAGWYNINVIIDEAKVKYIYYLHFLKDI